MSKGILLIVGLGNPGAQYALTRHNAGAWFVENLAEQAQISLRSEAKLQGLHGLTRLHQQDCHLFIPTTYMNRSGMAVRALANYYKIPPEAILIAHDEIDLPCGAIRLKFDGGHGGHNGLRDIIQQLGSKQFFRLRIGVGRPAHTNQVVDYVLAAPSKAERQQIDQTLSLADSILPLMISGQTQKAMQLLHSENTDGN